MDFGLMDFGLKVEKNWARKDIWVKERKREKGVKIFKFSKFNGSMNNFPIL